MENSMMGMHTLSKINVINLCLFCLFFVFNVYYLFLITQNYREYSRGLLLLYDRCSITSGWFRITTGHRWSGSPWVLLLFPPRIQHRCLPPYVVKDTKRYLVSGLLGRSRGQEVEGSQMETAILFLHKNTKLHL